MQISRISIEKIKEVYCLYMRKQFPESELRPLSNIEYIHSKNIYPCFGFFDGNDLIAYACLVGPTLGNWFLLDYYAVLPKFQSKGIGIKFLTSLISELSHTSNDARILCEIENPFIIADVDNKQQRLRRMMFYEKCGMRMTSVNSLLFGVDFSIMIFDGKAITSDNDILDVLGSIYKDAMNIPSDKYVLSIVQ